MSDTVAGLFGEAPDEVLLAMECRPLARAARGPPGNIRELQNVVERAVILSETDTFVVDESWLVNLLFLLPSPAIAPLHTV